MHPEPPGIGAEARGIGMDLFKRAELPPAVCNARILDMI